MGIFDNDINLKEEYKADDINSLIEIVKKYHDITFVGNGSELHKDLILKNIEDAKFEENNSQTACYSRFTFAKLFKKISS